MFDEGLKTVDHDDWPCHAYKEDMYDPNNIEAGLMKGEFLFSVRVQPFFIGSFSAKS